MEYRTGNGQFRKLIEAYEAVCKPFCQEIGISVQAFEILMFIARNKNVTTAQGICKEQNIKPTLMSFHIEKLVQAGYVERQTIDGNRRSIQLICTPAAAPVVEKGKELYQKYTSLMWEGIGEEEKEQLLLTLGKLFRNAENMINGNV